MKRNGKNESMRCANVCAVYIGMLFECWCHAPRDCPPVEALPLVSGDGPRCGLVGFAGACLVLFQAWLHHRPTSQLFAVSRHDASRHASPPSPVLQAVLLPLLSIFPETTSRHDPLPSPTTTTNLLSHTPRFLLRPATLPNTNTTNKNPPSPLHNPRRHHGLG